MTSSANIAAITLLLCNYLPMFCFFQPRLFPKRSLTLQKISLQILLPSVSGKILSNAPIVGDVVVLLHQHRGLHSASDVSNRQKYHEFQLGRERQQIVTAQLQAGQNMLLDILANPSLAGYLRRLVLYGNETGGAGPGPPESEPIPQRSFSPENINRLKQAIRKAGVENVQDRESILSILRQDPLHFRCSSSPQARKFRDALIMMLAANAPNLESLSTYPLALPRNMLKSLLQRASKAAPGSISYCQNLKEINFHPDDELDQGTTYVEMPYYDLLNVVRKLPAIESVAFILACWSNEAGFPLPPRCANYSKISFTHSLMQEHDLCQIIESSKTLKSFTFTIDGRKDPERIVPILSVTPILQSLWFHRHTLEVLDLDMEYCTNWQEFYDTKYQLDEDEGIDEDEQEFYEEQYADELRDLATQKLEAPPSCISLKDFPKLKSLSLGVHTLCYFARGVGSSQDRFPDGRISSRSFNLADHLPPNLESLRVYGRGERPYDFFKPSIAAFDRDVDAQLERLSRERHSTSLKILEGIDTPIPNGKVVDGWADESDQTLFWKDPDDNRSDYDESFKLEMAEKFRKIFATMEDSDPRKPMLAEYLDKQSRGKN